MKIVCDNCATKYSIADEKVRGKVFKIRCKKCSHIIVVKGGGDGAAIDAAAPTGGDSAETAATETPGDGWHVVINGEQVGPLSPTDIRSKVQAGELDGETYAWREGFGDWQKLAAIDDFRDLVSAAPAPSADATKRSNADDLFGHGGDSGRNTGDLFGSPGGDLFSGGAPAPAAQSGGLFAQSEPAPTPASKRSPTPGFGSPAMNAATESAPEGGKAMTGARSENSVLFSLNNLQALASGGGSAKASGGGGGGGGGGNGGVDNRAGFANSQTEGSGLIDIRAMAAATLSSSPSPMDNRPGDIPSFSSAPVFSPIAAPILMPAAPSGPPRWIWPVIAIAGAAFIGVIVVGVLLLNKKPDVVAAGPANVAAPAGGTAPAATGAAPTTATPAAPSPGATAPTPPANTGNASPPVAAADHRSSKSSKASTRAAASAPKGGKADSAPAPVADTPPPAAPTKPKKHGGDDLDDLLNGASPDKPSHAAREERAAPADENLPDQLSKNDIVGGMKGASGKVGACFDQFKVPGLAMVAVTIGNKGRITNASVTGAFAGTPTGDCVAKAVKSASFPRFKGAPQSINYPFSLR